MRQEEYWIFNPRRDPQPNPKELCVLKAALRGLSAIRATSPPRSVVGLERIGIIECMRRRMRHAVTLLPDLPAQVRPRHMQPIHNHIPGAEPA